MAVDRVTAIVAVSACLVALGDCVVAHYLVVSL